MESYVYLRIYSKGFFWDFAADWAQQVDKIGISEIFPKLFKIISYNLLKLKDCFESLQN